MIKITRGDSTSIDMRFDEEGNLELLNTFLKLKEDSISEELTVVINWSVVKMKRSEKVENNIIIEKDNNINGSVIIHNENKIIWKFDEEYIDMAIDSLSNSIQEGFFSPAEFVIVKVEKNKKLDYVYCERI